MVRIKMMIVALIIMVATPNLFAAWKVVIDKNCIKVVASNLASQKLIEGQHNQRLDSITEKKKEGGTLYREHGYHQGTLQGDDAERVGLRYGEQILQGDWTMRLRHPQRCTGAYKNDKQGEVLQQVAMPE